MAAASAGPAAEAQGVRQPEDSVMTSIVLIHGSTQNATCWDLVRPHLAAAGYQTITVELPADRPECTATAFARVASNQIPECSDDLVVAAHSASGMLLPVLAKLRPLRALMYLAALVPTVGRSAIDQFQNNPDMFDPEWVRVGAKWFDPGSWRELSDRFLFHDVPLSLLEWAHSTIWPMRIDSALREPLSVDVVAPVRATYVVCSLDRTINPEWQERSLRGRGYDAIVRLDAGHCPHISVPQETARAIIDACQAGIKPEMNPRRLTD